MILNITADYPDSFNDKKTLAVQSLLSGSSLEHFVISLNRVSSPWETEIRVFDSRVDIKYFCLPYGLFLRPSLYCLATRICGFIKKNNIKLDLIVAHKFSIEGVVAFYLSRMLGLKYGVALWGGTDRRVLSIKFELLPFYKTILQAANFVMPATPWIFDYVKKRLSFNPSNVLMLPVVTSNTILYPSGSIRKKFVTVFKLDLYMLKGLPQLLKAFSKIDDAEYTLDIYGNGEPGSVREINRLIVKNGLVGRVFLKGFIDNSRITELLSGYTAFLLPTTNETFGMVYIEAIFSGIPIMYSQGQGVDGYFDDLDIGVRVLPSSVHDISKAILFLYENQDCLKANIANLHSLNCFDKFKKDNIFRSFDGCLLNAKNS